jgi:ribonuclease HI
VLLARDGTRIAERAELIGQASAAEAEYRAILFGLELAREHGVEALEVRSDSQLAIAALRSTAPVAEALAPAVEAARARAAGLDTRFTWHARRDNELADALVRELLWP